MAEKLTFTAVELDKFSRNREGTSAKFKSSLTSAVIAKMNWTEMPQCLTGADLEGELACISLELIPSDSALAKHATQLDLAKVGSFKTVRLELEGKKGKGHRTELRFTVDSQDPQAARKLEVYMLVAGKSKMIVSYEPQAVQEQMPAIADDAQGEIAVQ